MILFGANGVRRIHSPVIKWSHVRNGKILFVSECWTVGSWKCVTHSAIGGSDQQMVPHRQHTLTQKFIVVFVLSSENGIKNHVSLEWGELINCVIEMCQTHYSEMRFRMNPEVCVSIFEKIHVFSFIQEMWQSFMVDAAPWTEEPQKSIRSDFIQMNLPTFSTSESAAKNENSASSEMKWISI